MLSMTVLDIDIVIIDSGKVISFSECAFILQVVNAYEKVIQVLGISGLHSIVSNVPDCRSRVASLNHYTDI